MLSALPSHLEVYELSIVKLELGCNPLHLMRAYFNMACNIITSMNNLIKLYKASN